MLNVRSELYESLSDYLVQNNLIEKRIFIYASEFISKHRIFKDFVNQVSQDNHVVICFKNFREEPETKAINLIRDEFNADYDIIFGFGGGSVLDISKFLSFLFESEQRLEDFDLGGLGLIRQSIPLVLIPTTSGSGSELTRYCVATNSLTRRKFTVSDERLIPVAVVHEKAFLLDLPERVRISSTLDAYIHCYEAFVNHDLNALSRVVCFDAIRSLSKGILNFNPDAISRIAYGSMIAGTLINEYRTGLIHTMSVALSEYTHLSHGLLNTVLFEQINNLNMKNTPQRVIDFQVNEVEAVGIDLSRHVIDIGRQTRLDFHTKPDIDRIMERIAQDKGLEILKSGAKNEDQIKQIAETLCYGKR